MWPIIYIFAGVALAGAIHAVGVWISIKVFKLEPVEAMFWQLILLVKILEVFLGKP